MRDSILFLKVVLVLIAFLTLSSCVVTNNLYVNNPEPLGKKEVDVYLGVGTGLKPKIDSTSVEGEVYFKDKISIAPSLNLGAQFGLTDYMDARASVHLPYVLGGIGVRGGLQHAFFKNTSNFNVALATDIGFVYSKDSLKLGGIETELDIKSSGAFNMDVFLPLGYRINEVFKVVITPRYSHNILFIRRNTFVADRERKFKVDVKSLALGLWVGQLYIEASGFVYDDKLYPNFGVAYIMKP